MALVILLLLFLLSDVPHFYLWLYSIGWVSFMIINNANNLDSISPRVLRSVFLNLLKLLFSCTLCFNTLLSHLFQRKIRAPTHKYYPISIIYIMSLGTKESVRSDTWHIQLRVLTENRMHRCSSRFPPLGFSSFRSYV